MDSPAARVAAEHYKFPAPGARRQAFVLLF